MPFAGWNIFFYTKTTLVVSIGRLTAFYVVLVPLEFIPSEPPLYDSIFGQIHPFFGQAQRLMFDVWVQMRCNQVQPNSTNSEQSSKVKVCRCQFFSLIWSSKLASENVLKHE